MTTMNMTDYASVASLNDLSTFLPWTHIRENVIPSILSTIIVLTSFYGTALTMMLNKSSRTSGNNASDKTTSNPQAQVETLRMATYRLVNLVTNAILGGLGCYHYYNSLPWSPTAHEQVTGMEELYLLACIQIGYQLWSLGMACFFIRESTAMMIHHVAVLVVATMSAVLTNGFRYHTPFFYGMIEISSVPLSVMNFFKDHSCLIERYPMPYTIVRLCFVASFLFIRIYMLIPRKYDYLQLCWNLLKRCPNKPLQIFLSFCWLSAFFLACLQVFWATLIVKGLVKLVLPKNKKSKTNKND